MFSFSQRLATLFKWNALNNLNLSLRKIINNVCLVYPFLSESKENYALRNKMDDKQEYGKFFWRTLILSINEHNRGGWKSLKLMQFCRLLFERISSQVLICLWQCLRICLRFVFFRVFVPYHRGDWWQI